MMITYKYYLKDGRRLTITGELTGDGMLITWVPCSKKDFFIKKVGIKMCTERHKSSESIFIKGSKFSDFILFCNESFYKKDALLIANYEGDNLLFQSAKIVNNQYLLTCLYKNKR
jgi:hypothetical protein